MPKIEAATDKTPLTGAEKRRYPDAFCLKCQAHTPTKNAHTVVLDNRSRAVTGQCGHCNHDVYRIIGPTSMQTVSTESVSNKGESSKEHKVQGVPLPIKANLRLIKSPTSQRRSIGDLASSKVLPRVLLGLIMVGLVAIGMMAINQH